jgi:DinB family protein
MMDVNLPDVVAILGRTPAALRALLSGLPEPWLTASEGEGTFSPRDVLGHLIHGEKTDWIPRVELILGSGDTRPFVPFDRFGFRDAIRGRSIGDLLDEFEALRTQNLETLRTLGPGGRELAYKGLHPELGPVTLGQLLATWAVHDLNHIGQIVRVMSRQYEVEVGPWKAYLGILNR